MYLEVIKWRTLGLGETHEKTIHAKYNLAHALYNMERFE